MSRCLFVAVALLAVAGCTLQPEKAAGRDTPEVTSLVETQPRARSVYNILVGELAGQRGDKARAAESYMQAARDSDNPAVAERAARIAVFAEREELAREAAARWQALAPDSAEPRRLRALLALRQGDSDAAYQHLKATLTEAEAGLEKALAEIGGFVANEAPNASGLAAIQRLAEDYPDQRMAHYSEAEVAMNAGKPEAALAASDRALEQSPDWRAARIIRVRALLKAGRIDEAITDLRGLVTDNPDNYDLRLQLARTLADQGRQVSALEQFDRLIDERPEDGRALYAGALIALERGDNERARRWLERLLATDQRNEAARYYLGRLAESQGDYEQARQRYSRVSGAYDHQAQIRLALMEGAEGEVDKAIERLERLRAKNPDITIQAWQAQGQLLREAGRIKAAIAAYSEGLEAEPGNTDLLYSRAMTHVTGDNVEAAERDLRAVLEKEPDNAHALNALGYTLADETERYEEAEELIRRAYAQLPQDPAVIDSMGWIAYKQGRLADAERYLREAYQMSGQAEIAAHLGEVLWQRGKREEAREIWNEALEANPDDATLQETMERLIP